ncbi:unnamed protein product [Urochloa humidicola]
MANLCAFHPAAALQAILVFISAIAVQLADAGDQVRIKSLKPSCRYLAKIPFGDSRSLYLQLQENASIIELVTRGFRVNFPSDVHCPITDQDVNLIRKLRTCLNETNRFFHAKISGTSPLNWTIAFLWSEIYFAQRFYGYYTYDTTDKLFLVVEVILYAIGVTKLLIVLCRLVFLPLSVYTFLAHKYWKTRIAIDAVEKFLRMQQMLGPTRFAYTDITAITSHFREKLGQGGYGSVYKGVLLPGDVQLAVKMLSNSNCNGDEFISEVSTIRRIHHINVVRLVGFCAEDMRRALVYEYMPHGSLDKYIFSSEKSLSWDKLTEIALGIARGIDYLHRGCDMQILHFDIKPHNILLDINFVPKVADFGLAKLYPRDRSFVPMSASRGTIGYIAPEMYCRGFGAISSKADIYSFGMLLLEMAGGRRNFFQNAASPSQAYYPSWVYGQLAKQEEGEISSASTVHMHELERKLCIVGLRCIQLNPHNRPTMSEIIEMLESGADGLQMPSTRPFFCGDDDTDDHIAAAESCHSSYELTAISEEDE